MKSENRQNVSTIKQIRDELALQAHLFGMEAKEEWTRLEHRFQTFEGKVESTIRAQGPGAMRDAEQITDNLLAAYRSFRDKHFKRKTGPALAHR